ncbi:hypothetical protein [Thomasclavelia cocleata]|uniref:hypothetical protein n=1 Tax=Thomasclavelia cocleata TaxID=69824 RepID=UPI00272E87F5|nr:hypothetical protein [Thomasclavelia cocleata]MCI9355855.1 hypothetical protein [Bacillota bacterium]
MMYKAVLSPCLLNFEGEFIYEEQSKHYKELERIIYILSKYCNVKFEFYKKAPYESYRLNIPIYDRYILDNLLQSNVYAVLQTMLDRQNVVDLDNIQPAQCLADMYIPDVEGKDAFLCYLNYVKNDAIMFIGKRNYHLKSPCQFQGDTVFSIDISKAGIIETTDVLLRYLKQDLNSDEIFPMEGFCSYVKYNDYVIKEIQNKKMNQSEKIALFEKIGDTVAKYNFYKRNKILSSKNSTPSRKRIVYTKIQNKDFHLSLDFESGGFEVFDKKYIHQGQYNFDCKKVKRAEPKTHKLLH